YTITVTIKDKVGNSVTATRTADVTSLTLEAQGQDVRVLTGAGSTPLTVASFSTSPPGASDDDFKATIDWGDGSTPTEGTIQHAYYPLAIVDASTARSGDFNFGDYVVTGQHAYAAPGSFTIKVTIDGPGGATAGTSSTATVAAIFAEGIS